MALDEPRTNVTNGEPHTEAGEPHQPIRGPRGLRLLKGLELAQDFVVVVTIVALYVLMARQVVGMWRHVQAGFDVRAILTDVLFLLILVEIFRLLIYYLRERHVAVGTMVEIGIISVLREVILIGPLEVAWPQLLAITAFLIALGGLLRFARFNRGRTVPPAGRGRGTGDWRPRERSRRDAEAGVAWTDEPRRDADRHAGGPVEPAAASGGAGPGGRDMTRRS
ncbi:MAG TPA: phosphate-starvation-inducible PsiE family protein [Thermodesulfobacteriota bacterium]